MSQHIPQEPTFLDSLKWWLAVVLILAYLPAFFIAAQYFGARGAIATFLGISTGTMLLRCSSCSQALFDHGALWKPWPWRSCPHCARPLVHQGRNGEGTASVSAPVPPNTSFERTREG
jgi:hypothetical protein